MRTALLLEGIHPHAAETLTNAGWDVTCLPVALGESDLINHLSGVHVLGVRSTTQVSAAVLAAAPELRTVGAFCIGTNQIDLAAANEHGVACFNAPFSNTRSVVELALGCMLALNRHLTEHNHRVHAGHWFKTAAGAREVRGQTLAIVGYGNIGSQLSVLAETLGMRVLYYDVVDKMSLGNAAGCAHLAEVLGQADVVSVHIDGRSSNRHFFGAKEFAQMRPGALFVNLSRGTVVDDVALADAIRSGALRGAAVDVFPDEPANECADFLSPLQGLPNVILTPHIGGSTEEAQANIGHFVANKLVDFLTTGTTALSVNYPQVVPGPVRSAARITYLHHNTPGALAEANLVFADHGVNIDGQTLATAGTTGYVVTDVGPGDPEPVVTGLEKLAAAQRVELLR